MSGIIGFNHISMDVPDVDAALRFYCEGLGLELRRRDAYNGIVITPDGVILEINPGGTDGWDAGGITHICFNTYDVDAAFRRALAYGAIPSREQDPEPYTYQNLRMAFVRTPSGEEIELWSIRRGDGSFGEPMEQGCYIKQYVHTALTVPDMSACVRFYEDLGIRLKVDWEWGCSMTLPDGRELELFAGGTTAESPKAYTHLCFQTDDVEATLRKITELGGWILHQPYDWSNLRIAFAAGLAGETIELFYLYSDGREPDVFEKPPIPLPDLFADTL